MAHVVGCVSIIQLKHGTGNFLGPPPAGKSDFRRRLSKIHFFPLNDKGMRYTK